MVTLWERLRQFNEILRLLVDALSPLRALIEGGAVEIGGGLEIGDPLVIRDMEGNEIPMPTPLRSTWGHISELSEETQELIARIIERGFINLDGTPLNITPLPPIPEGHVRDIQGNDIFTGAGVIRAVTRENPQPEEQSEVEYREGHTRTEEQRLRRERILQQLRSHNIVQVGLADIGGGLGVDVEHQPFNPIDDIEVNLPITEEQRLCQERMLRDIDDMERMLEGIDVEHQPFNPVVDLPESEMPITAVQRTGTLTLDDLERELEGVVGNIDLQYFHARWTDDGPIAVENVGNTELASEYHDNPDQPVVSIGIDRGVVDRFDYHLPDIDKPPKKENLRNCWFCGKSMRFGECYEANHKEMTEEDLRKLWEHKEIEIPCCSCVPTLLLITTKELLEVVVSKQMIQRYNVLTDKFSEQKGLSILSIYLVFKNEGVGGNYTISIPQDKFQKLLDRKLIDVPIELIEKSKREDSDDKL